MNEKYMTIDNIVHYLIIIRITLAYIYIYLINHRIMVIISGVS